MTITPPKNIFISSDGNKISFLKTIKVKNKEDVFRYVFIVSETKLNQEIDFTEAELNKQMKNFFQPIN